MMGGGSVDDWGCLFSPDVLDGVGCDVGCDDLGGEGEGCYACFTGDHLLRCSCSWAACEAVREARGEEGRVRGE